MEIVGQPSNDKSRSNAKAPSAKAPFTSSSWTRRKMGNCLKGTASDDVSLLRGGEGTRESSSSEQIHGGDIYQEHSVPVYYPSPNVRRPVTQLTEEEQVKIAKRIGLIQHLPSGIFDDTAKHRECVICMVDFTAGDKVRYMPCMHVYHVHCIDDWLMRSFTCPSCMEPVDGALFNTYETH
ncbi:unnamed protein product [Allacma fusca]|uniref:RING-type domain-containing protein n=1 Tax=Allacma fusca TaxID=39272 RepID=A0A8J2KPT7_9HEXA|nr:unnamed protein product [Allacma fusca]